MKRIFAILVMLFAMGAFAAAQAGGASGSTSDQGQAGKSDQGAKKGKKGSKESTLTGCLSGPNSEGAYELKSGKRTVEVGGNDELSKHVNHEVKLHGMWSSASGMGEKEEAGKKSEEKGERHFKVTSIDHISDTCKAAGGMGGMHHHKKGSSEGAAEPSPSPK